MREPLAAHMTITDENVLIAGLRAMSPMVKLQHMVSLQQAALTWLRAGIRRRQPEGDICSWRRAEAILRLGKAQAQLYMEATISEDAVSDTYLSAIIQVIETLDVLSIPYMLVGSLASTIHGEYRTTNDTDLVVLCTAHYAQPLVERLESSFLIRLPDVLDALTQTRQFSATHLSTMFRIDFFVRDSTPFAKMEFQRRQPVVIRENPPCTAWVATVEDTILSKLRWYQLDSGVSDRQWRDIQTMVRVNEDMLDYTYLQQWGADLQVTDPLDAALRGERPRPTDNDPQQTRMF
ncbi:MAG: hypothetical protein AAGF95_01580 [Chloroflexota bacterium]